MELDQARTALRTDPLTGLPAVGEKPVPARAVLRALDAARGDEAARVAAVAAGLGLAADEVVAVRTLAELQPAALDVWPSPVGVLTLAVPLGLGGWLVGAPLGLLLFAGLGLVASGGARYDPDALRGLALQALTGLLGIGLLLLRAPFRGAVCALALAGAAFTLGGPGVLAAGVFCGVSLTTFLPPVARWFQPAGRTAAAGLPYRAAGGGAVAAAVVGAVALVGWRLFREVFASMGVRLPWITRGLLDLGEALSEAPILGVLGCTGVAAALLLLPRRREGLGLGLALGGGSLAAFVAVRALFMPIEALQEALR